MNTLNPLTYLKMNLKKAPNKEHRNFELSVEVVYKRFIFKESSKQGASKRFWVKLNVYFSVIDLKKAPNKEHRNI